jgi:hypothetical protein
MLWPLDRLAFNLWFTSAVHIGHRSTKKSHAIVLHSISGSFPSGSDLKFSSAIHVGNSCDPPAPCKTSKLRLFTPVDRGWHFRGIPLELSVHSWLLVGSTLTSTDLRVDFSSLNFEGSVETAMFSVEFDDETWDEMSHEARNQTFCEVDKGNPDGASKGGRGRSIAAVTAREWKALMKRRSSNYAPKDVCTTRALPSSGFGNE